MKACRAQTPLTIATSDVQSHVQKVDICIQSTLNISGIKNTLYYSVRVSSRKGYQKIRVTFCCYAITLRTNDKLQNTQLDSVVNINMCFKFVLPTVRFLIHYNDAANGMDQRRIGVRSQQNHCGSPCQIQRPVEWLTVASLHLVSLYFIICGNIYGHLSIIK